MIRRKLKPIVKWAGGKGQLVDEIAALYPPDMGCDIIKYAEPFVGGGAILFNVLRKYDLESVFISDTNAELINMYCMIKDKVDDLIALLKSFEDDYIPADFDKRKNIYYDKRDRYNELIISGKSKSGVRSAALFIFLNRTCFNGLYRVNKKGLYNVPIGSYKRPQICDESNLRFVSEALQNVTIICADYKQSKYFIDDKTFVYFDPPYRPLTSTAGFTAYTENEFDDDSQIELANFVQELSRKGAHIVISNSDPKNIDPDDSFFDELYSKQVIKRVFASRMINSNAKERGKVSELLISNY